MTDYSKLVEALEYAAVNLPRRERREEVEVLIPLARQLIEERDAWKANVETFFKEAEIGRVTLQHLREENERLKTMLYENLGERQRRLLGEVDDLESTIADLMAQRLDLQSRLSECEKENERLNKTVHDISNERQQIGLDRIEELQQENERLKDGWEQMTLDRDNLLKRLGKVEAENERLKAESERPNTALAVNWVSRRVYDDLYDDLQTRLSTAEKGWSKEVERRMAIQSRLSAAENNWARAGSRAEYAEARLERAEEVIEAAKYVLDQVASEWPDLRDAIRRYEEGKKP